MKHVVSLAVFLMVMGMQAAGVARAQQPAAQPGAEQHHQPAQSAPCPMMSGMMGGGMMGMMGGHSDSPRMMQMRGEMMKAMGDIMMKYGKLMESTDK